MEKKYIRNFVIIAHIDHGKSTLADRFLELTKTVNPKKMHSQYLDLMDLEREKGITIKMQPVAMDYLFEGNRYLLNLIDTPGHVDFSYEVSRSLAAVEGAVLLVDAVKGIQAQTVANLELAQSQGLTVIPIINKIDLPEARIKEVEKEMSDLLFVVPEDILKISAKDGVNIEKVLETIIEKIPFPKDVSKEDNLRALIFDSKYDSFKGVIAYVRVFDGHVKEGDSIYLIKGEVESQVKEVGFFKPELVKAGSLESGEIGYIATGIKESRKVKVGDTILLSRSRPQSSELALHGYKESSPMVFLSVYPEDSNDFELLKNALEKLILTDASLIFKPELKAGLGRGYQCGFLGLLHAEIIIERLKREFDLNLILSIPSVLFKLIDKTNKSYFIYSPSDWPENPSGIKETLEQWAKLEILTPLKYMGNVSELLKKIKSNYVKTDYIGEEKCRLVYETPLREIVAKNFYDKVKSVTKGFASVNYEVLDWRQVNLVKLDILVLGKREDSLSKIVPESEVQKEGRRMVEKLKSVLPPQLFSVPLQAIVYGKIIARETIRAKRKDVIAPLYGGDFSRKRKLLQKQKKGKKKLKEKGKLAIPPNIFLEIFKSE